MTRGAVTPTGHAILLGPLSAMITVFLPHRTFWKSEAWGL